jgi:hypothetical protein
MVFIGIAQKVEDEMNSKDKLVVLSNESSEHIDHNLAVDFRQIKADFMGKYISDIGPKYSSESK